MVSSLLPLAGGGEIVTETGSRRRSGGKALRYGGNSQKARAAACAALRVRLQKVVR
jgi:hypothetical protein